MQLVDSCFRMPHHCAVTLKHEDPRGFVDTGSELPCIDPHIYLSVSWLHDNARAFGLVNEAEHTVVLAENEALKLRVADLEEDLKLTNAQLDAISVIESAEKFKARRKPGPKPGAKKKVAA